MNQLLTPRERLCLASNHLFWFPGNFGKYVIHLVGNLAGDVVEGDRRKQTTEKQTAWKESNTESGEDIKRGTTNMDVHTRPPFPGNLPRWHHRLCNVDIPLQIRIIVKGNYNIFKRELHTISHCTHPPVFMPHTHPHPDDNVWNTIDLWLYFRKCATSIHSVQSHGSNSTLEKQHWLS